jgi:hypothetical protein
MGSVSVRVHERLGSASLERAVNHDCMQVSTVAFFELFATIVGNQTNEGLSGPKDWLSVVDWELVSSCVVVSCSCSMAEVVF